MGYSGTTNARSKTGDMGQGAAQGRRFRDPSSYSYSNLLHNEIQTMNATVGFVKKAYKGRAVDSEVRVGRDLEAIGNLGATRSRSKAGD